MKYICVQRCTAKYTRPEYVQLEDFRFEDGKANMLIENYKGCGGMEGLSLLEARGLGGIRIFTYG